MKTAISFILCAVITVSSGTIQQKTFFKTGDSVGIDFPDVPVVPGVRSRLQCAALCDQHSSCNAIRWNQNNKTCQKLTKVLTPETTVSGSYRAMFRDNGYTYIAGMLVKFIDIKLPYQMAQDYCVNEGGRLAVLDTKVKYEAIQVDDYLQGQIGYIGATKTGGTWTWTTGQTLEPYMTVVEDNGASCLVAYPGDLDDIYCDGEAHFLCEK